MLLSEKLAGHSSVVWTAVFSSNNASAQCRKEAHNDPRRRKEYVQAHAKGNTAHKQRPHCGDFAFTLTARQTTAAVKHAENAAKQAENSRFS